MKVKTGINHQLFGKGLIKDTLYRIEKCANEEEVCSLKFHKNLRANCIFDYNGCLPVPLGDLNSIYVKLDFRGSIYIDPHLKLVFGG